MIIAQNISLTEGENGILLSFPEPVGLKQQDQYMLYFDAPIVLPENSNHTIVFEPDSGTYSIYGSPSFTPKVFVKIKSLKKIQTKTLIRLTIKDIKNSILYTDYMLVVCSPQDSVNITGRLTLTNINSGPNGGSVIEITGTSETTDAITIGSKITGPGLPTSETFSVSSIISSSLFEINRSIGNTITYEGSYALSFSTACIDPDSIQQTSSSVSYTILDKNNNWTYKIKDQIIVQFIPENVVTNTSAVMLAGDQAIRDGINGIYYLSQTRDSNNHYFYSKDGLDSYPRIGLSRNLGAPLNTYWSLAKNISTDSAYYITNVAYPNSPISSTWLSGDSDNDLGIVTYLASARWSNLVIFLPIKNKALLAKQDAPAPIPSVSILKVGGRVLGDTVCISSV
jgi:hypothetical protein